MQVADTHAITEDKYDFSNFDKYICISDSLHREMKQKQEEYLTRLTDLEQEIELLRQKAKLERYKKELDAIPQPHTSRQLPPSQLPALMVISAILTHLSNLK